MKKSFFAEKLICGYPVKYLLILIIISMGIIIRLANYLNSPGLWFDEALLALNLMERSYVQLLLPLDNFQVAPVLFLWIEKLNISLFGPGELALRFFPLICSVLSLPIFYFLAKNLLDDDKIALISLFIFAVTPIQIKYSAEVKQYSIDLFVFLILFWLFSIFLKNAGNKKSSILLAVAGVVSIFLSHIAVLVLFTMGIYWLISDIASGNRNYAKYFIMAVWLCVFGVCYYYFINNNKHEQYMLYFWQNNFMPLNPFGIEFLNFFSSVGRKVFSDFMIYNQEGFAHTFYFIIIHLFLIIYIAGLIIMAARHRLALIFFMTFPILLHLLLSGFKKYPFDARLALYLLPLVIMTFSYGLIQLYESAEKILKTKWPGMIAIIMILAIFPFRLYANFPFEADGVRESIEFINKHFRENQKVYVYHFSVAPFEYYNKINGLKFSDAVVAGVGQGHVVNWQADLNNLQEIKGEVWLLFSHLFNRASKDHPENVIMRALMKRGVLVYSFQTKNSSAYLMILK